MTLLDLDGIGKLRERMDDETKWYFKDAVKKRIKLEQSAPAGSSPKEKIERMAESEELTEDAITTAGEKGQRGFVAEAWRSGQRSTWARSTPCWIPAAARRSLR